MVNDSITRSSAFSETAYYRIRILGKPEDSFWEIYQGMKIETVLESDTIFISVLTVRVQDQSELLGLLQTLYRWHCTLISLLRLKTGEDQQETLAAGDSQLA